MEEVKITEESPGVKSSKRVWGSVMIAAGGLLLVAAGITAMFVRIADPATAQSSGTTLITTGAALLGVTVLEGIGKAITSRGSREEQK